MKITIGLILLFVLSQRAFGITHPFIIVKQSEYAALRARAEDWPWLVMKSKAIEEAKSLAYNPDESLPSKCVRAREIASACALAYILDPGNSSLYVSRIETVLADAIDDIRTEKQNGSDDHEYTVPPASAAFMIYLVLDIMYTDISVSIRRAIEDDCDYIADNHRNSWKESKFAIDGLKDLYHNGITDTFIEKKELYRKFILDETTGDGVFSTGPGYAKSRLFMDNRIQKKMFMDVCEYQGYHEFYDTPKFQNLYEWVMGYSVTPFNRSYTFGDSPPTKDLDQWAASLFRVDKFSNKAQRYGAWHVGSLTDELIQGRLLHYILCDSVPLSPERPPSRIFPNGGAWFLEDANTDRALAGALWNIRVKKESHTHKDVNAIHIAAYGEHILRNSGYDGWGAGEWTWIHNRSASSNTVMINNEDHSEKEGGGITEGLIGEDVDYASGSSGSALPNGHHQRNFFFVKPLDGVSGYFILIDEVDANDPSHQVNVALHPNSAAGPVAVRWETEYRWDIEGCNYSDHPVYVTIFLGTKPTDVNVHTGYLGSYSDCSRYDGKYLYSTYDTDENGEASIVSVLFPHDDMHPLANVDRIDLGNASGASVDHGNTIVDCILSSISHTLVTYQDISFIGMGLVYREVNENNQFYLVRKGVRYDDGLSPRTGFESDSEITIYMKGKDGTVISQGTDIIFYFPGITGVEINDVQTSVIEPDTGWIKVYVDQGIHNVSIETCQIMKGDINSDGIVDILDVVSVVNIILETGDPSSEPEICAADCNEDGVINILDVAGIINVILSIGTCPP
ncbi:MAG: heparinase II/III family protein [Gemmatimonadota bacterium]|nr:MAG: heparinase II/III family protein [Gemmatimonadota bacterium]